jgi:hypothetical protein
MTHQDSKASVTHRERLRGCPAFERFETLTGMRLSERELELCQRRANERGITIRELFESATRYVETNLARLRIETEEVLH